jgi:general secretion pathway protein G
MQRTKHLKRLLTEKFKALNTGVGQRGMTLVEIMIVTVILAAMATVLVTQVGKQLEKARRNQAKILVSEVGKALENYNTDCGSFPTTDQGLNALLAPPAGGRSCGQWGPDPYLKKMPKDPWGTELVYTSDGNKYTLKSLGKDKSEGGEGPGADISSDDL